MDRPTLVRSARRSAGIALVVVPLLAGPAWASRLAQQTLPPLGSTTTAPPPTTTTTAPSPVPTTTTTTTTTTAPSTTTTAAPTTTTTFVPPGPAIAALQLDTVDLQLLTQVQAEVGAAQSAVDLTLLSQQRAQIIDANATTTLARQGDRLSQLDAGQRRAAAAVVTARNRLKNLAIAAYVSGGPGGPVGALLSAQTIGDFARRQSYLGTVATDGNRALKGYQLARDASTRATLVTVDEVKKAQSDKAAADQQLLAAEDAVRQATSLLNNRQAILTLTRNAVPASQTDIPLMVLDAYQRAAAIEQASGCRIAWWALAGIGRVESNQGRAQHAHLTPNGDLIPHIVGVPLTGANGTALIVGSSGDFAHAEGPMQFIPSTWATWGRDGNLDGVRNPDNVYDAALGAAAYLCATSTSLTDDAGLKAAYLSYNHSDSYVLEVLSYARAYAAADAAGLIPPMAAVPLYQTGVAAAQTVGGTSGK